MAEYIKRDAALKALCQVSAPIPSESYIVEKCIEKINRLPMMEVVRCKDCKHYMLWEDSEDKRTCSKSIGLMVSSPDDFCSYGERKTETVHCKDCKHHHWEQEPCHGRTQRFCKLHKGLVIVDRETFCSYGERRSRE